MKLGIIITSGAVLIGIANGFVPIIMGAFLVDLSGLAWGEMIAAITLISVSSTFLGLFVAVSVSEVFEAQTFSNFFRFPMVFLCGLFFPIAALPFILQPISYIFPLTYGADILHGAINRTAQRPAVMNFAILAGFCIILFLVSIRNIRRKWIY